MGKYKMKKYNLVLLCSVLFGVLLSCTLDEDENLLFQLKNNLEVGGIWQEGSGGTLRFEFNADGSYTFSGGGGEPASSGTYSYGQEPPSSIFDVDDSVGQFTLYPNAGNSKELKVFESSDGDLQFKYKNLTYIQIS